THPDAAISLPPPPRAPLLYLTDPPPSHLYPLSLHDALPISSTAPIHPRGWVRTGPVHQTVSRIPTRPLLPGAEDRVSDTPPRRSASDDSSSPGGPVSEPCSSPRTR